MISGFDSSEAGEITVTVTYEGQTATLSLTVEEKAGGCGGAVSVATGSAVWGLLALAGAAILRRKSA